MKHFFRYVLYEIRPFIYAIISGASLTHNHGLDLLFAGGSLLAGCSFVVFKWRVQYRYKKLKEARAAKAPQLRKSYASFEPSSLHKNGL